jgi:hypothetical protein
MKKHGKIIYLVWSDIDPSVEDEWNQWINEVHVPDVVQKGGFLGARRLVMKEGDVPCKYLNIYEAMDHDTLKKYLEGPARQLRQDAAKKFGRFRGKVTRAILEEVFSFEPV